MSDEIENEEQLLGLKGDDKKKDPEEKPPQQERKQLEEEEKDQGVEMSQDFEGELYDMPEENKSQEDDDNKDEEEEVRRFICCFAFLYTAIHSFILRSIAF